MANDVVVYWPQRRLYGALARSQNGPQTMLYLLGLRADSSMICVVDISVDAAAVSGELSVVGTCQLSNKAKDSGSKRTAPLANCPQLIVECGNRDALRDPDALDRSIRVVSLGSSAVSANAQCHIVLYGPQVVARCSFPQSDGEASSPHEAVIHQLCEYYKSQVSSKMGATAHPVVEALGQLVELPFSVARKLWNPIALLLSAPTLEWLPLGNGVSLQSYSQCLALLSHRATALLDLILQWRARNRPQHGSASSYMEVVDFLIYLVVDYVLGLLWSSFLANTALPAATEMNLSLFSFLDGMRTHVVWLMDAPAGFKLNVRLAAILGNGILMWLDFWEFLFKSVIFSALWERLAASTVLQAIVTQLWTHAGVTLQLSAIADVLWLVTWNSYWICLYFTKLHAMQLRLLSSLWKLFLGKKNNVLRKRVDSCEYDVNQLLLGTLLFTIVVFLVTTNAVFFVFFGLVRLGVWLAGVALWLPVVALRCIPVASLLHRILVPRDFTVAFTMEALTCHQPTAQSLVIRDVSPGRRRERDSGDRAAIRDLLSSQSLARETTGENQPSLLFRAVPRASSIGQQMNRLGMYHAEIARSYTVSGVLQSCLFGADIPRIDPGILFRTPQGDPLLCPVPQSTKSKVE